MPFQARIYNSPKRLCDPAKSGPGDVDVISLLHEVQKAAKKVPLEGAVWKSFNDIRYPSSKNGDGVYTEDSFSLSLRYFIEDSNRIDAEYCYVKDNQHFVRVRVSGPDIDTETANRLLEEIIGVYDSFFK